MDLKKDAQFLRRLATDKKKEMQRSVIDFDKSCIEVEIEALEKIADQLIQVNEFKRTLQFFF